MAQYVIRYLLIAVPAILCSYTLTCAQSDSTSVDNLRTQSGIDPTRIVSKVVYSFWYFDRADNISQINNRLNFTVGINRWSFSLKPELVTVNAGTGNEGFQTKGGDLRFSILNAFLVTKRHSLAAAAEINLPTGAINFGGQYFSINPSLTYAFSINPSLLLAIQPQYLFHVSKNVDYPDLSVFTLRPFLAKFFKTGWFMVFEPRLSKDFTATTFDLVLSPIVGTSLGGGFNLSSVLELPTRKQTREIRGVVVQVGVTKNF